MRGTEKQLAYAGDLISNMSEKLEKLAEMAPDQVKSMWEGIAVDFVKAAKETEKAGDVIDLLKINDTDPIQYYKYLTAHAKIMVNNQLADKIVEIIKNAGK